VLCLRCANRRDAVPDVVKVTYSVIEDEEEKVVTEDIAGELRERWKEMEGKGYRTIFYCTAKKAVVVGFPPSPAATVTECGEFAEA